MNKIMTGLLVFFLGGIAMAEDGDPYRIFTDTEGRSIEARIVEFNSSNGKLLIERKGGKTVWVPPNIFSETDRTYIKQWVAADQVLSEENLGVTIKEHRRERFGSNTDLECGEIIYYELSLENRSDTAIENLAIEYRWFGEVVGYGTWADGGSLDGGALSTGPIGAHRTIVVYTKEIRVREKYVIQRDPTQ